MKGLLQLLIGIGIITMLYSCASGDEAAGDKAYKMANRTSGDTRRTQLKTAYIHYRRALTQNPDKASTHLRNRFIEMSLVRANMVLTEGSAAMGAIPLLMDDIEEQLKDDVKPELRQQYAAFLVMLGDSSGNKERFIDALAYYDRAIEKASDAAPFREKRNSVIKKVAEENYQLGRMELELGISNEQERHLIRAEYFAKVALYFDSTYADAQKLLGETYQKNVSIYSAFVSVVDDYTDTVMFRRINRFDILLAVPATQVRGRETVAQISMYSNTFNPLRMRSEHFALVDANGEKYPAISGQKMSPDILDQEREAQYTLRFPTPSARVKKLVYENGPHFTEKIFF